MGNCFGSDAVRHVSGPSTAGSSSQPTPSTSAECGNGVSRKNSQAQDTSSSHLSHSPEAAGDNSSDFLHAFTYSNLKTATRNFRPDSCLGEGGFGMVFKGNINERTFQAVSAGQGIQIAVKKLKLDSFQGHKEWLAEIKYLAILKHPNIVKLIGYCCEEEQRLLVYEYLPRGSLENHLFGRKHNTMSWPIRLSTAVGAARGLRFLHDADMPVIFRDFKTANILLDSDHNAKLSDFGLAKDGPMGDQTHVTTRVLGTLGYAAPEYVMTGKLTAKNDVYGFGVVLLEILTGKRAVEKDANGEDQFLTEWAMPYLTDEKKWSRVIDQRLHGQYSRKEAQQTAIIALRCLSQDPRKRPTMKAVLESLESLLNPKHQQKYSSSCTTSKMKHVVDGKQTSDCLQPNQEKHVHAAKQGETAAINSKLANACRLSSPQQIACTK